MWLKYLQDHIKTLLYLSCKHQAGQNFLDETGKNRKHRPLRWIIAALGLLAIGLVLIAATAWTFRTNLAESYIARYCDQRGLECEADVQSIGLSAAEIASLRISANGREPLKTGAINAAYDWAGFLSPRLGRVTISDPVLRAGFDGTRFDLGGLDKLAGGGGGGEPVNISIENGRVVLVTPAGELTGEVNVSGALPQSGKAQIRVGPAQLQSGDDRLAWTKGEAELTISGGRVTGTAEFQIDDAVLGALNVDAAVFEATLAGSEDAPAVQWRGEARKLALGDQSLINVKTHGEASLSELPDGGLSSALEALQQIAGEVSADAVNLGGVASEAMTLNTELTRSGETVSGPIAFTAKSVSTLTGLAQTASASGELVLDPGDPSALEFAGSGLLNGAAMYAPRRQAWLEGVGIPEPFSAHGAALSAALDKALSGFDSGADFEFSRKGDRWQLSASRPTVLRAVSGMTVSIEPAITPDWLLLSNDGLKVSGEIVASGGGGPTLRALLTTSEVTPERLSIDAATLELEPWTENDRTLSVELRPFRLESTSGRLRVSTGGDVTIAGAFPGTQLKETTLSGGFEATRGAEGWRIQTGAAPCLDLKTKGVTSGAVALQPVALNICPEDRRFVRTVDGKPTGTLSLGDVRLPFATRDSSGQLDLTGGVVDWQLGDSLRTEIKSESLSMPLKLGAREVAVNGAAPFLMLETGDGPLRFSASLGASTFSGDLIPANVSAAGFTFTGGVPESGLAGTIRSGDVRIEDYRKDPIYTPLRADLTANVANGRISMTGPLRLQRSGWTIAEAKLEMGLSDLTGTASLAGRDLQFRPDGLQPHDLSDLLRPILPNARGMMKGNADFTITRGQLAGTGNVSFQDLSFDTFRLGKISGVNGTVRFSDILDLTTLPDQIVSVGMIDPGVPLQQGRIAFQLIGGRLLQVEGARWPFAGGELFVAPTSWELGGRTELVTITADRIQLSQLIETLSLQDEFRAEGTVSGTFPIEIIGPNAFVRGAVLKADETGGKLAYIGNSLEPLKGRGEVTDYAVEALKDFRYRVLEVGVDGNLSGDIEVSIGLEGRSPEVLYGTEFRFNVAVDSKLAQLLRSTKNAATGDYITSIIAEQIETNANSSPDE